MLGKEREPADAFSRATARRLEGHSVYTATLLAVQLKDWDDIIERVESAGWRLASLTPMPLGNSANAVALFRVNGVTQ